MATDEQQRDESKPMEARVLEQKAGTLKKIGLPTLIVVGIGAIFAYAIGGSPFFIGVVSVCGAILIGGLGAFVIRRILGLESAPYAHNTPETHERIDKIEAYDNGQLPIRD